MTASSNAMRTMTSIVIHQLLLESSESRRNLRIRRIALLILVSELSTFCSKSSSILDNKNGVRRRQFIQRVQHTHYVLQSHFLLSLLAER